MAGDVDVDLVPGLSTISAVASRLGAPLMSDFAIISLSDLLVPWKGILYRLEKAASADMVLVLYNPGSRKRRYHLSKALKVVSHWRPLNIPV
jgi:precorrin-3B methylase